MWRWFLFFRCPLEFTLRAMVHFVHRMSWRRHFICLRVITYISLELQLPTAHGQLRNLWPRIVYRVSSQNIKFLLQGVLRLSRLSASMRCCSCSVSRKPMSKNANIVDLQACHIIKAQFTSRNTYHAITIGLEM